MVVGLGPMIRQPNYEVGPEFVARFRAADAANERFFKASARAGHALFDLAGYIAARLRGAAASSGSRTPAAAPMGSRRNSSATAASTHRGEPDYGRHVNAIALAEQP